MKTERSRRLAAGDVTPSGDEVLLLSFQSRPCPFTRVCVCVCVRPFYLCSCWPIRWFFQPGVCCAPLCEGLAAAAELLLLLLWARGRARELTSRAAGRMKEKGQSVVPSPRTTVFHR